MPLLVLRGLLVFNAVLLLAVGALLAWFMEAPAGLLFGTGCCLVAAMMLGGVRHLDRLYERRR